MYWNIGGREEGVDIFRAGIYIISIITVIATIWVGFLNIGVGNEAVPTLVNGITSSMSVIVGFCGAIIGIMFREIGTKDSEARNRLVVFLALLMAPITMLWTTYSFLTMAMYAFAVKYALVGLIYALYIFVGLIIFVARELIPETKKKT